jgi:hypothetical protein
MTLNLKPTHISIREASIRLFGLFPENHRFHPTSSPKYIAAKFHPYADLESGVLPKLDQSDNRTNICHGDE